MDVLLWGDQRFQCIRSGECYRNSNKLTTSIINLKIFNKEVRVGDVFGKRIILEKPIGQTDAII
jgi:hypothetical protein